MHERITVYDLMRQIASVDGLTASESAVALVLAIHADEKGFCYPGIATIAKITHLDERTVRYDLISLEKFGMIIRTTASKRGVRAGYMLRYCDVIGQHVRELEPRGKRGRQPRARRGTTVEGSICESQPVPVPVTPTRELVSVGAATGQSTITIPQTMPAWTDDRSIWATMNFQELKAYFSYHGKSLEHFPSVFNGLRREFG